MLITFSKQEFHSTTVTLEDGGWNLRQIEDVSSIFFDQEYWHVGAYAASPQMFLKYDE